MKSKVCPDAKTLEQLLLGKLPSPQRDELGEHLLQCKDCSDLADTISASDELTAAVRARKVIEGDEAVLAEAIERAKQLRSQAETVETDETIIAKTTPQAEHEARINKIVLDEEIDFLAPAEQPDEIGRLGDYRVLEVLGVGGMGVVFRAEDPKLERDVALKAMKPAVAASRSAKDRFLREAKATAAIEHDNIVHIYQVGEDRGVPFIAMQLLRGESLQKRVERETQLDQREVLRIGREVATGLEAAHERDLVHRDIKPDNIWIEDKSGRVKIVDFGLVRTATDDAGLTQSGMVLGTPRYMAPEQAQGQTVDHRCDLFSLGSVLYHLAAGKAPFEGGNLNATLIAVAQKDPDPVDQVRPDTEPSLSQLIMRLLSKRREDRPQSAAEVAETLAAIEKTLDEEAARLAVEEAERLKQQQVAETTVLDKSPVATPEPNSRTPLFFGGGVVAIALAVFGWLWASGVIFKVETKDGTLIVKVTGEEFSTAVQGQKVAINNVETNQTTMIDLNAPEVSESLKPGTYFMLTTDSGLTTPTDRFTIRSGVDEVVEVRWEPKEQVAKAESGGDEAGSDAVAMVERPSTRRSWHNWPADAPAPAIAPFDEKQARIHQEEWADFLGVSVEKVVDLGNDITLVMTFVPPGEFTMGSTQEEVRSLLKEAEAAKDYVAMDRIRSEAPAHRVRISRPFYLGKTEVTQAQWEAVMGENPSHFQGHPSRPVEQIRWADVHAFLGELNRMRREESLDFVMPSEAQWEFACRGGSVTRWNFGDSDADLHAYGWFGGDATHPVGQLKGNAFGLFDVHGNVFEWCNDWWKADFYKTSPIDDPVCRDQESHHVLRGGGWYHNTGNCRSAYRHFYDAPQAGFLGHLGFRLAASIDAVGQKLAPAQN